MVETEGQKVIVSSNTKEKWVKGSGTFLLLFKKILTFLAQVCEHYEEKGFDFLLKAFNEPNFLEDLTGLSKLHADTFDAEVTNCYLIYLFISIIFHVTILIQRKKLHSNLCNFF